MHLKGRSNEWTTNLTTKLQMVIWLFDLMRHSKRRSYRVTHNCSMRSKLRWFTEFCNSQLISRFAAFFIVMVAEVSTAKNCEYFHFLFLRETCVFFQIVKIRKSFWKKKKGSFVILEFNSSALSSNSEILLSFPNYTIVVMKYRCIER